MKKFLLPLICIFCLFAMTVFGACDNLFPLIEEEIYTVTVEVNESSYGSVSATSVENVAADTAITASGNKLTVGNTVITATPAAETAQYIYSFENWIAPETVTEDVTVTANFTRTAKTPVPEKYTVIIYKGTGSGEYEEGATVTATATVPEGKVFVRWTSGGVNVSTANPYVFTATEDVTLTAVFEADPDFDIRADAKQVSVSEFAFDFDEGLADFAFVDKALVFDYKAVDNGNNTGNGFMFTIWGQGWNNRYTELITVDVVNNTVTVGRVNALDDGWYRVTIPTKDLPINRRDGATGNETLGMLVFNVVDHALLIDEVDFVDIEEVFTYTVTVNNGTGGGEYEEGAMVTVTAIVPEGQSFFKWTSGGEDVSTDNPYTFKAIADITLTAIFTTPIDFEQYTQTLYVEDGKDFVILNLTDYQLHDGKSTYAAFSIIDELVEKAHPDLITILGDTAEDNGNYGTKQNFKALVDYIDALGIPWAPIYGNHDNDAYREENSIKDVTCEWINATFAAARNCLYMVGPDTVTGNGNYIVNIVNRTTNKITKSLFFFDSGTSGVDATHVAFYADAVNYCTNLNGGETPESIVYLHIPLPEYTALYDSGEYQGIAGEKPSAHGTPDFFAKIKELGSTKHVMCGHDHINSFYGEYQGVYLMYCLKSSDGDYFNNLQMGGTTITIGEATTFEYHFVDAVLEVISSASFDTPSIENFASSGKAFTFDYQAVENSDNTGDTVVFTLWKADWGGRLSGIITVDIVNDSVIGSAGRIEDIGDGWRRLTINCSDLPLNTSQGADGTETIGMIYFNTVDHAFRIHNLGSAEEYSIPHGSAIELSGSYTYQTDSFSVANFASSGKAFTFEYKAVDKNTNSGNEITFTLWKADWGGRLSGIITLDVVNDTVSGCVGRIEDIGEGWRRLTINCSALPLNTSQGADGTESIGMLYFNTVTHAFMLDSVGFVEGIPVTKYTITVENGTGSGEYEEGASVTATATVPEGKVFVKWMAGETEVSTNNPYTFTARANVTLTAIFEDGASEPDVHANAIEITGSRDYQTDSFSVANFASSGKAFTFEYKAVDKNTNSGNEITFTLWKADWGGRLSGIITLDVVNDTVSGCVGRIEDIGDGWRRLTINCSALPLNSAEGADGTETIGMIYFNTVTHAFMLDSVGFVDAYTVETKVMLTSGYSINLPDYDSAAATLEFDIYAVGGSSYAKIYWRLYDADGNYFGDYRVSYAGLNMGYNHAGVTATSIGTDTFHVVMTLSELTGGSGTPGKLVRLADNGSSANLDTCWIDNIEFKAAPAVTKYTITVENGTGSGEYEEGASVTATATVPEGKVFVKWMAGETEVSTNNPYTFTARANVTLTATFEDVQQEPAGIYYLSNGISIDLPDCTNAETISIDFHMQAATDQIIFVLADEAGNYYGPYRYSYSYRGMAGPKSGVYSGKGDGITQESLSGADGYDYRNVFTVASLVRVDGGTTPSTITKFVVIGNAGSYNTSISEGVYIDNIEVKAAPADTKITLTRGYEITLPDYDSAAATLEFDIYAVGGSSYAKIYWRLYDADGNYFGDYRVSYAGLNMGYNHAGVTATSIGTDTFHVVMTLSELTGGSGTPGKLVRLADNGSSANLDTCWIDNIEFKAAPADTKITLTRGYEITLPDYDSAAATLEFDIYAVGGSSYAKIYLRLYDADGNYFGDYRFAYNGINTGYNHAGVTATSIGENTWHVVIVLSELTGGSGTPGKLVKMADNGSSDRLGESWIDNIKFKAA